MNPKSQSRESQAPRQRSKNKRISIPKERLQLILQEPLPSEVEQLSSTAREKWVIRHTPVTHISP